MVTDIGKIRPIKIEDEMRGSYLDYAMSVIVSRALPDVRDGLKPVHRRILYAMNDLHLNPNSAYKKSARIVGEVLGKYHPHSDSPVYDAMVRMAQEFSMRYMLVDGQGNFGSVDNDPPAAMRYTEARLAQVATEMLADIDMETVDFTPNFDDSLSEPTVLPARIPSLLMNGSSGIAVGMATNIPPHNLGELCDALVKLIDDPDTSIDDLMDSVHGPDFPTRAEIWGREGIRNAYTTGRGKIIVRAKADIVETNKGKRSQIIVTELPFQLNKASLVEKIADLVRDRRIEGITEIRDESDREGLRVVIELRKDQYPDVVLNNLYQNTPMQSSYFINMLALVDGAPRVIGLKSALESFIDFRREDHSQALPLRAAQGSGAGSHPGGLQDRPRQPGCHNRHNPPVPDRRGRPYQLDPVLQLDPGPGTGHPRHAAAPHRPARTPEDRRGIRRHHKEDQLPRRPAG